MNSRDSKASIGTMSGQLNSILLTKSYFFTKIDTFLLQRHFVTQLFVKANYFNISQLSAIIKNSWKFKFVGSVFCRLFAFPEFVKDNL